MTYFPDLTPYRLNFGPSGWGPSGPPSLNPPELYTWMWDPEEAAFDLPELTVGWLEPPHEYRRGKLPGVLVEKLERLCRESRYHLTRGIHPCGFCGSWRDGLGSAEIRIQGEGVVYAAPTRVAHYVSVHGYAPPEEFVAALHQCDGLAKPRIGARRPVTIDMIPREDVNVERLEADVQASLRRNHREGIFLDLSIQDYEETVRVFSRFDIGDPPDPHGRLWLIPKAALLNMTQSALGIISMLESVHTQLAMAELEEWRRTRGKKS